MPRSNAKKPGKTGDLHGSAPDQCRVALLIIDMINAFDFDGAEAMLPRALAAAKATAGLKLRARKAGVPVVYVNDNFGRWRSDFRSTLAHCLREGVRGRPIAAILKPDEDDYFVLKPKHSGFQFTAHDAYMRDYHLVVPGDCIASQTEADDAYALAHMAKVTKADTRPSSEVDFSALQK